MTHDEHLLRWLAELKPDNAKRAIQVLCKANLMDTARVVLCAQKMKGEPRITAFLNTMTAAMLGDDE